MKLPLLILSFLFCISLFGQKIKKVDWLADNQLTFKAPEREIGNGRRDDVFFNIERGAVGSHMELFSLKNFKPLIDTSYKISKRLIGGVMIQDTFYIERISKFFDNAGSADIQYFHPNGQLEKRVNHIPFIETYTPRRFERVTNNSKRKKPKPLKTMIAEQYYGVADGIVKSYYPSGQLEKVEEYDTGTRNGKFQSYYRSGQIKEEKEYNDNCPINGS